MAADELSYEEVVAIFDALDQAEFISLDDVSASAQSVRSGSSEPRSERSLRRVMKLGQFLLDRESVGLAIEFNGEGFADLAKRVGYRASQRWVTERVHWFLLWRRKHEQRSSKVDSLLGRMWVPVFEDIPGFLLTGDGEMHSRTIRGRVFKWKESTTPKPIEATVERCWFSGDEHSWLIREAFDRLPPSSRKRFRKDFDDLQQDCADYVTRAARRRTAEEIGEDQRLLAHTVREAARLHYIGDSGFAFHQFADAVRLATGPNHLEDRISSFTESIRDGLNEWWGGNRSRQ